MALSAVTVFSAPLKVVASTPDLASIIKEIGGQNVKVDCIASPFQNPHFVDAKPSMIVKLMNADLFVQTGMDLEIGWAPLLIQSSGNKKIQFGAAGFLDASQAIVPMEVPLNPSRAMGDVHPQGNPHYLTDPENGKLVARVIAEKLSELAPAGSAVFHKNMESFQSRIDDNMKIWLKEMEPHKGDKFVSYHRIYPYFAARFGLVQAGEIEPKPGIPPSASHTASLMAIMKAGKVRLILTEPWHESRTPQSIARETGAQVVTTSLFPGSAGGTKDYIGALDYNVKGVAQALQSAK